MQREIKHFKNHQKLRITDLFHILTGFNFESTIKNTVYIFSGQT